MVLHLLGKKSWNVYNKDNVDRVRRDEAAAAAKEAEAERRMQDEDAARRIAILRGEVPPPISSPSPPPGNDGTGHRRRDGDYGRDRKQRRLKGEDDTDRDMRLAKHDAATAAAARENLSHKETKRDDGDVSITDHAGHIQLFAAPDERTLLANSRNAEAEAEKKKKTREYEDQYTMRFSNAAGFKQSAASAPWYASSSRRDPVVQEPSKDVWGNEDPGRQNREQTRLSSNDPMAFMRRAQTQLKQAETDREKWKAQKTKELRELEHAERSEMRRRDSGHRHRRRERKSSMDSLEGFTLDASSGDKWRTEGTDRHRSRDDDDRRRRRHASSRHSSHRSRRRSRSPV